MRFPSNLPCSAVLDSLADGVFTVDKEWNITFFNEAASRITGIHCEEAVGYKCWEVFHSSLCDGNCALRSCMKHNGRISNKSIFFIHADGKKVPVSISAAPLVDSAGKIIGGVESFRDLTDIQIMRREVQDSWRFEDIIGKSKPLAKVFSIMPQVSKSEATVLLLGESGTGKELFARAIHNLSDRKHGPFVAVNCGALPDNLLESELFGYKAGAFTDARKDKPGRFELAAGGTIFLDEIGDMPPKLQVKLLRVLQEKTFEPLGAVSSVNANVRIVAATNRNLAELVENGTFRQDLFYRLNVVTLNLPSLKQRAEDIPLLINHFINRLNALQGKNIDGLSEDSLQILMRHPYPGNVRELENILEFAFILCPSGFIQIEHLPEYLQPQLKSSLSSGDQPMTLEEVKCLAISRALERNNGKKMATCRELGISKDTLRRSISRCEEMDA
ncbi:PAS domain S-box-containing protein [Maridesulfovibrio ferrireducens]|uniref:PAS domain S-box-containing protein n=1 Tax=Maridesulfovibrio ferrireducens TaxID=246191 RepID=A0A1G9B1W1_9BACT|nr:sigma 54-interacting transcriptional regulator [Maridesulfovibrio ferrireducens]SDK33453.1 PAS domain S-box-containing protein [Maridesulfovibrio ferrireducens]